MKISVRGPLALIALSNVPMLAQQAEVCPPRQISNTPTAVVPQGGVDGSTLVNNGGFVTQTGVGAGGLDVSEIETGFNTFGYAQGSTQGFRVADDFVVPSGATWTLSTLKLYGYQTNSTSTSTFTGVTVQIWSGDPSSGGVLVAGDTVTNRLITTGFTNVYRVTSTTLTNAARPIMENEVDMTWCPALAAGTYYIDFQSSGTLASGPWANPTVPRLATDNGLQFNVAAGTWGPLMDGVAQVAQDVPYVLEGTSCGGPQNGANSTPGTLVPATGTGGGGAWPGTYPPNETALPIQLDCAVNCVNQITIDNFTHSWIGDVQFVLEDPTGVRHNVMHRPGYTGTGFGNSGNATGGAYIMVDPSQGAAAVPTSGNWVAGTYSQHFGNFPSGTNNTFNTPMNSISGPSGIWTLRVFDWEGGDSGLVDGWSIDTNTCAPTIPPPFVYCTAKVNGLGCTPAIAFAGTPSVSTGTFDVSATNIRNEKSGLLFYSTTGQASTPFQGGTLCMNQPISRTPVQFSGGTPFPGNDCTGTYSIDMNAFAQGSLGGTPDPALLVIGTTVDCQFYGRDPGFPFPDNSSLTDAVEYTVGP